MRFVPMLAAAAAAVTAPAVAQDLSKALPGWAPEAARRICEAYRHEPLSLERLVALLGQPVADQSFEREHDQLMRARLVLADGDVVTVVASLFGTERQRVVLIGASRRHAEETPTPVFDISVAPDCTLALAEALAFDDSGKPDRILRFSGPNLAQEQTELLNPPVPPGADPGGIRVAQVDTGVAYDLPEIASRLARDGSGRILGWDFRDNDDRPYDRDPGQALLFARQHGTGTASVLLTEAKEASLIPFRYPGHNAEALGRIPHEAARRGARIVTMSLGTSRPELWKPFVEAVQRHPEILFVVSAGNDGRDIDADPVYPAAFRLDNMVVVTSAEADGRIARGSNWGARNVDLAVPAERIPILSPSGAKVLGSGPSYAAPRVAALAARVLAKNPALTTDKLKRAILAHVKPMPKGELRLVRVGWIPDPTAAP
ncbi:MAG: S8 family serine peptidase [Pseudomonadota bacterium]|nr:S8 family serine peptidase [Pseudomonadota bacterium]